MTPLATNVLLLVFGLIVLYYGADWLVRGSARLAASMGVAPLVVGLTVVSLGTSAPELAVSLLAALRGTADISLGNVMGSNMANIGLILGLTAIIRPLEIASRVVRREVPIMLVVTLVLFPVFWDLELSRSDGFVLLLVLGVYLAFVFRSAKGGEEPELSSEFEQFAVERRHISLAPKLLDLGLVVVGSIGLVLGASAIVESAEFVAEVAGIPPVLISLSVIAVGTSLPELATSLVAALRSECDIAVGNIIGSNIFNVAAILGITGAVHPLDVNPVVLASQLPAVLLLSIVLWPITWSGGKIRRWEGAILLALYLTLMLLLFRTGLV